MLTFLRDRFICGKLLYEHADYGQLKRFANLPSTILSGHWFLPRTAPYTRSFSQDVPCDREQLAASLTAVFSFIEALDLEPELSFRVKICSDELLDNVVSYSGSKRMRLDLVYSGRFVSLSIADRGVKFDSSMKDSEFNGLGLTIIHAMCPSFSYRRMAGANVNFLRWNTDDSLNVYDESHRMTAEQLDRLAEWSPVDTATEMPILRLRGIHKTYPGETPLHVLKGVDLDIGKGEFVSIMGASGSGKSTLLNIIGILDSYDEGEYYLGGYLIRDLRRSQASRLRNELIGFIFQSFNLINFKNALENVALPLYYRGIDKATRTKLAMDYLEKVGLAEHWDHTPLQLSGGQRQRVAIARALISHPKIILADEPTGALDSKMSQEVVDLLRKINREEGQTVVIVTHEPDVAAQTDRRIFIKDGVIYKDERSTEV